MILFMRDEIFKVARLKGTCRWIRVINASQYHVFNLRPQNQQEVDSVGVGQTITISIETLR